MSNRIFILGFGMVGSSAFDLMLGYGLFTADRVIAVDGSEQALARFVAMGGKEENCFIFHIDSTNYLRFLDRLAPGDILVGLAEGIDSCALLEECCRRGIHYVATADDSFMDISGDVHDTEQLHLERTKELRKLYPGAATSVLQFGCNPGLISVLAKKAIIDIINEDEGAFVSQSREELGKLIADGDFAEAARRLKVRTMIETDLDTTETDISEDSSTLYSTWNVRDFEVEMNREVTFLAGTSPLDSSLFEQLQAYPGLIESPDLPTGRVVLKKKSKEVTLKAVSPGGLFDGCMLPHEELFSLYDYFAVRGDENTVVYAPTVIFLYRPCPLAFRSLFHEKTERHELITNDHVLGGGETVGIVVSGDNFRSRYVYTPLSVDHSRFETPTVLQVSASLVCALKYILDHPNEGVLMPEHTQVDEILRTAKWHLPVFSVFL